MMFGFFRSGSIAVTLVLSILYLVVYFFCLFAGQGDIDVINTNRLISINLPWFVQVVTTPFLVFFSLLFFTFSVNKHRLLDTSGNLPLLFSLLILTTGSFSLSINKFSILLLVLTFAIYGMLSLSNQSKKHSPIFNISIVIGIGSLFYFPIIILILWVYHVLLVLRNFKLREWIMPFIGVGLPYVYFYIFWYLKNGAFPAINYTQMFGFNEVSLAALPWFKLAFTGVLIVIVVLALPSYFKSIQSNKIMARKSLSLITWLIVYAVLGVAFFRASLDFFLLLTLFPVSLLLSSYFEKMKLQKLALLISLSLIIAYLIQLTAGLF
tara:strand:- start:2622 stop:3590 length:969 start_codon:yes stop_codon:yes gene_type:complete